MERNRNPVRRGIAATLALASLAGGLSAQATEQWYVTPAVGTSTQRCGLAMAVQGDVMVCGAPYEDTSATDAGAVHVFRFDPATSTWNLEQELFASDAEASARFGSAVAIDGNVIVVGSPLKDTTKGTDAGQIYVFRYNAGTQVWSQEQKLTSSVGAASDNFGTSVAISGNALIAGTPRADTSAGTDSGAAVVFRYQNSIVKWVEEAQLVDPSGIASDNAGASVAIAGSTAIVSSHLADDAAFHYDAGAVQVFTVSGTTWSQVQRIFAPSPQTYANFGAHLRMEGDLLVVAAPTEDESVTTYDSGAVYIYRLVSGAYVEEARLTATTPTNYLNFGSDVAVSGDTVLVGYQNDIVSGKYYCGSAYLFRNGKKSGWVLDQQLGASDATASDHFGVQVGINDGQFLVAADGNDTAAGSDWGVVYGFNAAEIALSIEPSHPAPNETITFSAYRDDPGEVCMVTIEDIGGSFTFLPVLVYVFGADHTLTFTADAPGVLYGITIGMRAYKLSPTGGVVVSGFSYLDI
jgi:hypothetical protein